MVPKSPSPLLPGTEPEDNPLVGVPVLGLGFRVYGSGLCLLDEFEVHASPQNQGKKNASLCWPRGCSLLFLCCQASGLGWFRALCWPKE